MIDHKTTMTRPGGHEGREDETMERKNYVVNRVIEDTTTHDYHLGSTPDQMQAVTAAKNFAAQRQEPIDVTAIHNDHTHRTVRIFPDGHVERLWEATGQKGTTRDAGKIKQDWPGFTYTGELLEVKNSNGEGETYRVVTGHYTPSCACRDCGDHYIIAGYSSYRRINKKDLVVQFKAEDK